MRSTILALGLTAAALLLSTNAEAAPKKAHKLTGVVNLNQAAPANSTSCLASVKKRLRASWLIGPKRPFAVSKSS